MTMTRVVSWYDKDEGLTGVHCGEDGRKQNTGTSFEKFSCEGEGRNGVAVRAVCRQKTAQSLLRWKHDSLFEC